MKDPQMTFWGFFYNLNKTIHEYHLLFSIFNNYI